MDVVLCVMVCAGSYGYQQLKFETYSDTSWQLSNYSHNINMPLKVSLFIY